MPEVLRTTQYRLSRVYNGGQDYCTYNKIVLYSPAFFLGNAKFVEGFGAAEFRVESYGATYQFRKQTTVPVMLHEFDKFVVAGSEISKPQIRSWLSPTIEPAGFQINEEQDIFDCKVRDIDASHGETMEVYNGTELGTNTDVEFYDRSVRTVGRRNMLNVRARLTPTPAPEWTVEKLLGEL